MPRTFYLVVAVQFISTLADNALLIVAIARALELAAPAWVIPLLKLSFTLSYVLLAPFVGPIADFWRKGRVMVVANLLKAGAVVALLVGQDPLWVLAFGGLGAAIYAPAKYGLITELLAPAHLVRANGYFEGATVCAVILGTALGGAVNQPRNVVHGLGCIVGCGIGTLGAGGWHAGSCGVLCCVCGPDLGH
jgi:MFS transporter, LPLT family, lysophospholipid transporter